MSDLCILYSIILKQTKNTNIFTFETTLTDNDDDGAAAATAAGFSVFAAPRF